MRGALARSGSLLQPSSSAASRTSICSLSVRRFSTVRRSSPIHPATTVLVPQTVQLRRRQQQQQRTFTISVTRREAKPLDSIEGTEPKLAPADVTPDKYHQLADAYMDALSEEFERIVEGRSDADYEFSQGVLKLELPQRGTWVINKQPANKQIWVSSPVSGPKRYDWVVDLANAATGEDYEAVGNWIYLRDGSMLNGLLKEETGIEVAKMPTQS